MNEIGKQILSEIGTLNLKVNQIKKPIFFKKSLTRFLTSKEVFHVSQEKKDEIFSWKPSIMFPEYAEFYESLADDVVPENDYTGMKDGHNVSELFASSKRYRVDADYLRYIKSSKDGFIINVYGGENSLSSNVTGGHCGTGTGNIWKFTACPTGRKKFANKDFPNYEFADPEQVVCATIGEPQYWDKMLISMCRNPIAVLAIDLPHKYYSNQNLDGNIFTWDIVKEKYQVGGLEIDEINSRIENIASHGFLQPLVMRIDEGCLTPIDDDTAIDMFLATYLNLPTIPTILYMSDEDVMKNKVLEELHDIVHSNLWHNSEAMAFINNICKPYFYFELASEAETNPFLIMGSKQVGRSQYLTMNNIDDPDLVVFDRYLDKDAPEEVVLVPMSAEDLELATEERNKELLEEEEKKWRKEMEETNRRILAGEY